MLASIVAYKHYVGSNPTLSAIHGDVEKSATSFFPRSKKEQTRLSLQAIVTRLPEK